MKLGDFDTDRRVLVVAEVGNNHEGNFALAQELVGLAAQAGADAVKFQTFLPEHLASAVEDPARVERLRSFQLTREQFAALAAQAESAGLLFFSTPFDLDSARFLDGIQPCFKIASGDNTFYPLIDAVAESGKPILLSTGLADVPQVRMASMRIREAWRRLGVAPGLALLHCVTSYPVPPEQAALRAMRVLEQEFPDATIGYSDHTLGIQACILAVAAGARIVEKHFTLDKNHSDFRDHQLSADPDDLRRMVLGIREAEILLGQERKVLMDCEAGCVGAVRRSIAAGADLPAGKRLAWEDLTWVRPGTGLAPGSEGAVLGRRLRRALHQGQIIRPEHLEPEGEGQPCAE